MSGEPHLLALAGAEPGCYWLDDPDEPDATDTLVEAETADLCVVGGGYTGLWTALLAKERDPNRDVVLLEGGRCGSGASGRNGGFFESSLTHGVSQGLSKFAPELPLLEKLGLDNLNEIERFVAKHQIDCDWERNGVIDVATRSEHMPDLAEQAMHLEALGQDIELLDAERMQAEVHSPTYHGGLVRKKRAAVCDPARLVFGMKQVALDAGVRIFEDTNVTELIERDHAVELRAGYGSVRAAKVALGTNARLPAAAASDAPWCRSTTMSSPPSRSPPSSSTPSAGRDARAASDSTNQFHYYRLTYDNRIIWGGYDAVYYFNNKVDPQLEQRPETFALLSKHFFETFPQLEGLHFSHVWGGAIDTSTRFTVFWGRAMGNKVVYAMGYTGLGASATRFGARAMLDLLDKRDSPIVGLDFVNKKPLPFPPEPLRWAGIQMTRWSLDKEDRTGERNLWLRSLDRIGLGFDS
ncbi:MAG: FAD-dependent oxidoreductase [Acidimicrobiales bacterium]